MAPRKAAVSGSMAHQRVLPRFPSPLGGPGSSVKDFMEEVKVKA